MNLCDHLFHTFDMFPIFLIHPPTDRGKNNPLSEIVYGGY
jgi:hypothetical protein